ncbi:MAG: hypothetical protein Q9168_004737 [Polycauliona sp. 1 TL-2023]
MPLKRGELLPHYRKQFISLLGSSREREELFSRYEIYDALEELLQEEERFDDLLALRLRRGQLKAALEQVISENKDRWPIGTRVEVEQLIDFAVISRLFDSNEPGKTMSNKLQDVREELAMLEQHKQFQQWCAAIGCLGVGDRSSPPRLGLSGNEVMKLAVSLLYHEMLNPDLLQSMKNLEDLSSETVRQAITTVKDTLIADIGQVSAALLAVCGVWRTGNSNQPFSIQPWSPLSKELPMMTFHVIASAARDWVVQSFSKAIYTLNDISDGLWKQLSPSRCAQFLNGWLSGRSWQERLVRALACVSSFEQDEATMNNVLTRIRNEETLSNVASGLEALLFFRMKNEWTHRNTYSSLLEQMQLATALGIEARFFRGFLFVTHSDSQGRWKREQLDLLRRLERDAITTDALAFHGNLTNLRIMLSQIQLGDFSAFHSVTTMFEFLATYLTFRTCGNDSAVPRSWLSLHVSRLYEIVGSKQLPAVAPVTRRPIYQDCFLLLIQTFCNGLRWLDNSVPPNHKFQNGNSPYRMSLIQPRNAELLAVALLNLKLSAIGNAAIPGFQRILEEVNQVLQLKTVRQSHLRYAGGVVSVCQQLAQSYNKYKGKDSLIIIHRSQISNLQNVYGVQRMTEAQVLALESRFRPTPHNQPQLSLSPSESFEREDIDTIKKMQLRWRTRQLIQQSGMKAFKIWQIAQLRSMMGVCASRILRPVLRYIFSTQGLDTLAGLADVKDRLATTHASIMSAFDVVIDITAHENFDRALTVLASMEASVDAITDFVSDSALKAMIRDRQLVQMRNRFATVEMVTKLVKQGLDALDAALEEAFKASESSQGK